MDGDVIVRRRPGAQERIRQLVTRSKEYELQAEYFSRVTLMLMHLVPKDAVAQILVAAKQPKLHRQR